MKLRDPQFLNRLSFAFPVVTLALLIALAMVLPSRVIIDPQTEQRKADVREAMDAVPFLIGDWAGEQQSVPREAQKLLRPNAIFSRMYLQQGKPWAHVLVVHCTDARDMIGHYPPVCYPSSGWVREDLVEHQHMELASELGALPVHQYEFRMLGDRGLEQRIRIFNAFILPDGRVTPAIDDINDQSERRAVSAQGVAQLQIITPAGATLEDATGAAEELLEGMTGLLQALRVGSEGGVS